jgi:deoxyxylulose-5-phosphate synthase
MHILADEPQPGIPHHGPRQESSLQQDLEAVADAQHQPALIRKPLHRLHHRRKPRDRPRTQVISIRKSAGEDDGVALMYVFGLMPDEFHRLLQDMADSVKRVVIAIGSRKDYDPKFHDAPPGFFLREFLF